MKVTVKLFATFRIGREKIQVMDIADDTKAGYIINKLDIDLKDVAILLINGMDGNPDSVLKEGDVVAIFPPVGGG